MISYQLPKVLSTSSGKLSPFMTGCQETNPSTSCILFLPRHSQRPKIPGLSIITNVLICQSHPLLYFLSLPSPFSTPSGTKLLTLTRNCTSSLKVLFAWQSSQKVSPAAVSRFFSLYPCTSKTRHVFLAPHCSFQTRSSSSSKYAKASQLVHDEPSRFPPHC